MFIKHVSKILLAVILSASIAEAAKLPKPPGPPPTPTPRPAPPTDPQYEGIGRIEQITRMRGGEIYRLDLSKALPLTRIEAKSKLGRLKIYSTTLVTDKNDRVPVRQIGGIYLEESNAPLSSELFDTSHNILAIEVFAEAMGGEASLEIRAFSTIEAPKLNVGSRIPEFSCRRNIDSLLKDKLTPVQQWTARAEASTPGSVEEKFVGNQLREQVADFLSILQTGGAYTSTEYLLTLINYFGDQYNTVRAGGASEPAYKDLLTGTYNMLLLSIQNELPCRRFSSETLIKMATDFNSKFQSMSESSRAKQFYAAMMTKVRDFAPGQYRKELAAANLTFREADTAGTNLYKLYIAAPEDDFLKNTQRDMSAQAYVIAEQALKAEVKLMDIEQRYQLIVEYQAKFNANKDFPQAVASRYLAILADEEFQALLHKLMGDNAL